MLFHQFYNCVDTSSIQTLALFDAHRPYLEYANQVWDPYTLSRTAIC